MKLIQKHHVYLVDNIRSLNSSLLDELYTREVIDRRDNEQLRAEQTESSCNEKLLSLLGCRSAQQFEDFLSSLIASEHEFVVEELMGSNHWTLTQTKDNVGNPGILKNVSSSPVTFAHLLRIKFTLASFFSILEGDDTVQ